MFHNQNQYLPRSLPSSIVEDDCFVNVNNSKHIECIIPTAEIMVTFRGNTQFQRQCYVYAEKIDLKELIQLRLTEKCDQRKMYISTVDSNSFQELKQDQSLHVSFSGFVENLIHLLKECHAGNLELNLQEPQKDKCASSSVMNNCGDGYQLQFVERRSFKNLVHLSLPTRKAPVNVVLFYMNNILEAIQKKFMHQEKDNQQLQNEIFTRNQKIEILDTECKKLRETIIESARNLNQQHAEEIHQLQEKIRTSNEHRQQENDKSRNTISALQKQIDQIVLEKQSMHNDKVQEEKRNAMLNEELSELKIKLSKLKESNDKLHQEISILKNSERKHDMHLQDCRKEANDLKDALKKVEKTRADLMAELEAEKKISHTKRQALEIATEEISKANQIILKQSQELNKLKKVISWRTEVALQQEQTITAKNLQIKQRDGQIDFLKQTVDALRIELPKELDSMRKYATALDAKYSERMYIICSLVNW
ncbi:spindle assembly abnormal protein 6 homolog isoform X2 [Musca domestica]|uniref:Spindle assembly abnormal protein 6 homolog isoform X2 n=1 Tax=Musca domestica TaxID=7370 RepID=A0A9J7DIR0_MUSDO|nr:spindle assembly abnormal protein 6 homolog isoform X2 [Musca domestica]